ncbi:MAG: hypothetical protein WAW41_10555, partial [Methylobacter sp.]
LPNNIEFAIDFAKRFRINTSSDRYRSIDITPEGSGETHPLEALSPKQQETVYKYIDWSMACAYRNQELFEDVIESDIFEGGNPLVVELVEQGAAGQLNNYKVTRSAMRLTGGDHDKLSSLIESGYVPVIGNLHGNRLLKELPPSSIPAKELAALLAIQSVEMFFPATKGAPAEVILEAREKLHDHLPLFWASMLKLSIELKAAIKDCKDKKEVFAASQELVDTIVRPAVLDLNHKIELERKQWFHRIFGSVYKALRMTATNPPLTQEQLIRSSLMLGADAAMNLADHLQKVESMKNEAGLAYLLELGALVEKTNYSFRWTCAKSRIGQ